LLGSGTNSFRQFIEDALEQRTTGGLVACFDKLAAVLGFDVYAYHFVADDFRRVSVAASLRAHKVPVEWLSAYIAKNYFEIDPIMAVARRSVHPFRWFDAADAINLTEEQRQFFVDFRSAGFVDGYAVPVYSRPGDIAYFCVGSCEREFKLESADLLELQALCQIMHNRYQALVGEEQPLRLSPREREVLKLLVQGRSNADIAQQLALSVHTVDTLVKRCFQKMGVNSRTEAAVLALSRGLALLQPAGANPPRVA
jgi:LuxR family transcriptional regulator/LuxR family quorum-sensing system transcriptional regulator CciR